MQDATQAGSNVKSAVPFFGVTDIERSLKFYIDGLGFRLKHQWTPGAKDGYPEGKIVWCWLELGQAALMLQEFRKHGEDHVYLDGRITEIPTNLGAGVSINFQCRDSLALYREFRARGIEIPRRPFVGNGLWCVDLVDPDGYKLSFNSPTDAPEESVLQEDGSVAPGSCDSQ